MQLMMCGLLAGYLLSENVILSRHFKLVLFPFNVVMCSAAITFNREARQVICLNLTV
jgi:hypothetical protein